MDQLVWFLLEKTILPSRSQHSLVSCSFFRLWLMSHEHVYGVVHVQVIFRQPCWWDISQNNLLKNKENVWYRLIHDKQGKIKKNPSNTYIKIQFMLSPTFHVFVLVGDGWLIRLNSWPSLKIRLESWPSLKILGLWKTDPGVKNISKIPWNNNKRVTDYWINIWVWDSIAEERLYSDLYCQSVWKHMKHNPSRLCFEFCFSINMLMSWKGAITVSNLYL